MKHGQVHLAGVYVRKNVIVTICHHHKLLLRKLPGHRSSSSSSWPVPIVIHIGLRRTFQSNIWKISVNTHWGLDRLWLSDMTEEVDDGGQYGGRKERRTAIY